MAEEGFKRKLTAILSADVIGYSRLMRDDEEATVRDIAAHRVLITEIIQQHNGRVVDSPGDNILAEFASVVDAVNGAIKIQAEIKKSNTGVPEDRRMEFRIGINLGDVIEEEERIYGDGVNIAARVEGLAAGGGIAISGTVYEHIKEKLSLGYHYLGEQEVKNISEPVRVYRLLTEPADAGKMIGEKKPKSKKLTWAASGAIALIILAVGAYAIWNFLSQPEVEPASIEKMALPLPERPSIAVLPFDNLSGDPEQEYIADGFTENIITGLSQIPEMFVIARNSVFTYKGKPIKVNQVSEELGVKYVLEGSIQKSGDRLRVNAQLIHALKGNHLWAERYDRELKDFFKIQDEITIQVVHALHTKLVVGERSRITTTNLDAWRHVIKGGRLFDRFTKEDNRKAIEHFEQATKLDSGYIHAWEWLAWAHLSDGYWGWSESPEKSIKKSLEIYQKTSEGWSPEGRPLYLSQIHVLQRQLEKAISEGEEAVARNPNNPRSRYLFGASLSLAARPEEAIVQYKEAMRLEPYYPAFFLRSLATAYEQSGNHEEALTLRKKLLERALKGEFLVKNAHRLLVASYARLNRMEEARYHAAELLKVDPNFSVGQLHHIMSSFFKDQKYVDGFAEMLRKAGLPENPPLKLPDKPSIAVLAFDNLSGDPGQEYIGDGIAENIITTLSKLREIFVISRNSSFTYKGKPIKVQQVSKELGVRYVLEGSVQRSGDRVRVIAQLIDAIDDKHLWSERYDRDFKDIFELQDEITSKIVISLRITLSGGTEGNKLWLKNRPSNLQYNEKLFEANYYLYQLNKEANIKAKQLFKEAINIEPGYFGGYTGLAYAHFMDVHLGLSNSPRESLREAFKLCKKAITLDETQDWPHIILGHIYSLGGNFDKGITEGERAIALNPNSVSAYKWLAWSLTWAGRAEEAIELLKKAQRLNPKVICSLGLGNAYRELGQYDEALIEYKKCAQINPMNIFAHECLAETYALAGRYEEARDAWSEVLKIDPKETVERAYKICLYGPDNCARKIAALHEAGIK